jgi:GNAT superfamily N-acetyltransferase
MRERTAHPDKVLFGMSFRIRDLNMPDDKTAALSFILGSQHYEHAVEPDRRLDSAVADEHYAELIERVATNRGRVFIAEENGCAIGWAVFLVERKPVFVVEEQRTYGYIAELFVNEGMRGRGAGRALIAACEDEARRLGLGHVMIGVLAENKRAAGIYARAGYSPYSSELRKYL